MNDDEMDELLIQGARDYNAPGNIPRDEMWTRIAESRKASRDAAHSARPAARAWTWVRIAVAAAVVLTVGIAIGRRLEHTTPIVTTAKSVPARPDSTVAPARDTIVPRLREETTRTQRRVQELASTNDTPNDRGAQSDLAYRLVMLRHIAGSEAMITAFRASARRGEVDAQMASWARDLVRTTRLLESSPITEDPTMKRLLEDLELVLLQIAQYTTKGTVNTEELDLIEQSINTRGVITKLRSTRPVRAIPTGT